METEVSSLFCFLKAELICGGMEMDSNKKLVYNILGLLRAFDESQGKLANDILGISSSYFSEIMNERKRLNRSQLEKISKHFGISPEALMNNNFAGVEKITSFENFGSVKFFL